MIVNSLAKYFTTMELDRIWTETLRKREIDSVSLGDFEKSNTEFPDMTVEDILRDE